MPPRKPKEDAPVTPEVLVKIKHLDTGKIEEVNQTVANLLTGKGVAELVKDEAPVVEDSGSE